MYYGNWRKCLLKSLILNRFSGRGRPWHCYQNLKEWPTKFWSLVFACNLAISVDYYHITLPKLYIPSAIKDQTQTFLSLSDWGVMCHDIFETFCNFGKDQTFWEALKIWKNLPRGFDKSAGILSKRQNHEDFFSKFVCFSESSSFEIS